MFQDIYSRWTLSIWKNNIYKRNLNFLTFKHLFWPITIEKWEKLLKEKKSSRTYLKVNDKNLNIFINIYDFLSNEEQRLSKHFFLLFCLNLYFPRYYGNFLSKWKHQATEQHCHIIIRNNEKEILWQHDREKVNMRPKKKYHYVMLSCTIFCCFFIHRYHTLSHIYFIYFHIDVWELRQKL